jgi:hypothetical protein
VAKNINTSLGCDDASGAATDPATGYITVAMPSGVTTATLIDVFRPQPAPHDYYDGSYVANFSGCTGGTATDASYTVSASPPTYPTPPGTSGTLPTVTASTAGGTVSCAYSISVTGSPPQATIVSVVNAAFITFSNDAKTHVATISVKPFTEIPPGGTIPEVPWVPALVLLGGVIVLVPPIWRRWLGKGA